MAFLIALFMLLCPAQFDAVFPPCEYEDSTMCYWDAEERGNGQGRSFVSISEDLIIYL